VPTSRLHNFAILQQATLPGRVRDYRSNAIGIINMASETEDMVFTFEHPKTGERHSTRALNESVARLRLTNDWYEYPLLCEPCKLADLGALIQRAQDEANVAHQAMLDANPMSKVKFASADALTNFSALKKRSEMLTAWCSELAHISAGVYE
jgi:hypothetical protein